MSFCPRVAAQRQKAGATTHFLSRGVSHHAGFSVTHSRKWNLPHGKRREELNDIICIQLLFWRVRPENRVWDFLSFHWNHSFYHIIWKSQARQMGVLFLEAHNRCLPQSVRKLTSGPLTLPLPLIILLVKRESLKNCRSPTHNENCVCVHRPLSHGLCVGRLMIIRAKCGHRFYGATELDTLSICFFSLTGACFISPWGG